MKKCLHAEHMVPNVQAKSALSAGLSATYWSKGMWCQLWLQSFKAEGVPALQKGDRWLATGVVREYTTAASVAAGVRLSVRFATDLAPQAAAAAAPKAAAALQRGRLNVPGVAPAAERPFWMLPNWDDWLWPGPAPYGVCRIA